MVNTTVHCKAETRELGQEVVFGRINHPRLLKENFSQRTFLSFSVSDTRFLKLCLMSGLKAVTAT
jgi:hypothetical protein